MTLQSDLYPTILELALLHYTTGAFGEALSLIEETGSASKLDHALLHIAGLSAYRLKLLPKAITFLEEAIARAPEAAMSWNALGEVLRQSGDQHGALKAFRRAIEIDPMMPDVFSNLGNLYADVSDEESATASYRSALAIDATHVDAWFNFGNLLFKFQRYSGALEAYQKVLELAPTHNAALNNYGALLHQLRQLEEAKEVLAHLLSINPRFQDGVISYAKLLEDIGNDTETLAFIEENLARVSPEAAARLHVVRGRVLATMGDREAAKMAYQASLEIDPLDQEATRALINVELAGGDFVSAKRRIKDLLTRCPGDLALEFARCFFELKAVYETEEDIIAARASYETRLDEVIRRLENLKAEELIGIEEAIGSAQPFLLPYQGLNDRALQKKYGEAISTVMRRVVPVPPLETRSAVVGRKVRVGFVSGFFRNHSNYKIPIQGWLRGLQNSNFEVFCYHTQALQDECTDEARKLCHRFEQGPRSVHEWARLILADAIDVIIYPEIGMDPMSCRLACLRLAPSQAASWGHPETSGIPTIDYFLSSDLMEPSDADQFYTEKLVRLPNLSFSYEVARLNSVFLSRETFGVSDEDVLFWCPQTNSKYLPRHDRIFPEIAKNVSRAKFIFVQVQPLSESSAVFRARLEVAFQEKGLNASELVRYVGPLDGSHFRAAASLCDLALDTFEWSGCNSTLETLAVGTPVITCPGAFMRSRHSAAILRMIGCEETIANTPEEYVRLAVKLANDRGRRLQLRVLIENAISKAYGDGECARALQDTLTAWASPELSS